MSIEQETLPARTRSCMFINSDAGSAADRVTEEAKAYSHSSRINFLKMVRDELETKIRRLSE